MKYFILLAVLFSTISVVYSFENKILKCYYNRGFFSEGYVEKENCTHVFSNNGTSCAIIRYIDDRGILTTKYGCYFKMKEPKGMIDYEPDVRPSNSPPTYPANYTSCEEDLCNEYEKSEEYEIIETYFNGSENFGKNFSLWAITAVSFILSFLFYFDTYISDFYMFI